MTSMAEDRVSIRYEIPRARPDWTLPEEPVPESQSHDQPLDLAAFLFAVNEGQRLRIADDPAGTAWWMTGEESALARVRELEDQLRRR